MASGRFCALPGAQLVQTRSWSSAGGVVSNVQMSDLSLTNRQEEQLAVQIDAAINPGNQLLHRLLRAIGA